MDCSTLGFPVCHQLPKPAQTHVCWVSDAIQPSHPLSSRSPPDSLQPDGLYSPWNSPGQNAGAGSRSRLQRIFPTQGSNPSLLHCRWILHCLSHQGSPRILEWVVYPFSSRSSWPRNWIRISCIAVGFFTSWATREALYMCLCVYI